MRVSLSKMCRTRWGTPIRGRRAVTIVTGTTWIVTPRTPLRRRVPAAPGRDSGPYAQPSVSGSGQRRSVVNIFEAVLLGAVEGVTEFLPISSTGHLTIMEKLLGYEIDSPDITAFTAIIQSGAVFATVWFLRKDIARIVPAWVKGLFSAEARKDPDWRFGWA